MTDDNLPERQGEPAAPDLSGPPSLRDAIRAFTTPGTDPDALMDALRASRMPSVPIGQMGKAAQASAGYRWCPRCGRPEPANMLCPDSGADFAGTSPILPVPLDPDVQSEMKARAGPRRWQYPAGGGPELPADPFPEDMLAGLGIAQMLEAMEAGGVPPLRAERIVGAMLAAHGMMAKEEQGEPG